LPRARQRIRQRHQRREEEVKANDHHRQPGDMASGVKGHRKDKRSQRQHAQGGN